MILLMSYFVIVCDVLTSLDVSKSSGPDGISARMTNSKKCCSFKRTIISTSPSEMEEYQETGNYFQLRPFLSQQDLTLLITTYQYPFYVSLLKCWRSTYAEPLIYNHLKQDHPLIDCHAVGLSKWSLCPSPDHTSLLQILEYDQDVCAVFLDYRKALDCVQHKCSPAE